MQCLANKTKKTYLINNLMLGQKILFNNIANKIIIGVERLLKPVLKFKDFSLLIGEDIIEYKKIKIEILFN